MTIEHYLLLTYNKNRTFAAQINKIYPYSYLMSALFTAFLLGLLMILDPCTLFTSIAAIGYIDREMQNKRRVFITGIMFALGKLLTYLLFSIPFIMGAQTDTIQHFMSYWGEPLLAVFMILCGIFLFFSGHLHHNHDHGMNRWLQTVDDKSSGLWAFMLGIFFAIAFCPHRLMYFFTMIEMAVSGNYSAAMTWSMPIVFALATALPILLLAWLIAYSTITITQLNERLHRFEHYFRYACALIFLCYGLYLTLHLMHHHEHEHTFLPLPTVHRMA